MLITVIITLCIILAQFTVLQALLLNYVVHQPTSRVYSTIVLRDANDVLIATNTSLLLLSLNDGILYELPIKKIYDLEILTNNSFIGSGEAFGRAYLTLLTKNFTATSIRFTVNSALYDSIVNKDVILSTGYVLVDSFYKILLTRFEKSEVTSYIVDCPSSCYGRKLLVAKDGKTILVGSLFLRGQNYQWSYDVFYGVINNTSVVGSYISLEGNEYVVNSFIINNSIYTVVNSDLLGLHIVVTNYEDFSSSAYRVLVDGKKVECTSSSYYEDLLLIVAEDLELRERYVVLLNTSSGSVASYYLGNILANILVVDGWVILLNSYADPLKSELTILDFEDLPAYLKRFNTKYVSLNAVRVPMSQVELVIKSYGLSYEVSTDTIPRSLVDVVATASTEPIQSTFITPPVKSPYTLKGEEATWGKTSTLIVGVILILVSIILKYLMRIRS
ncbi:MAG: hypothetical protein QXY36_00865 [Sulfolobales archaeon]